MSGTVFDKKRIGMSRKEWQEKCVTRRKMKEEASRRAWESTDNYFRTWNVRSSKYESLGSPQTFMASMNAYEYRKKDEAKMQDLDRRRKKLGEMLKTESESHEASSCSSSAKEPILNSVELKAVLRNTRIEQISERQRESRPKTTPCVSTREKLDILPSDRTKDLGNTIPKKRDEVGDLASEQPKKVVFGNDRTDARPDDDIDELVRKAKDLEAEANVLKGEHVSLLTYARELRERETRRSSLLRSQTKDPFATKLVRPYKVQLQIQNRRTIESLEFDVRFLDCLSRIARSFRSSDHERISRDIEQVRKKLVMTLKREQMETEFIESLYQEEAKSVWLRKQSEWNVESDARDTIVKGAVHLVETQVRTSIATVLERLKENVDVREDLMRRMDSTRSRVRSERQKLDSYDDCWNPSLRLPDIEQLHLEPVA